MTDVPFLDVRASYRSIRDEVDAAIGSVLDGGQYIGGEAVERFEREFAASCGADHAVGTGNGLDALTLILRALDVGPGDEVIVPAHTFIATWLSVTEVGAVPVPVEVLEDRFTIDPERVAAAIGPRTRAIVAVHLYGQPADLAELAGLAQEHRLALVEDAAQAHGATYRDRPIGAHGAAVAWSFYPGKNLGAFGDGGAVTTDDAVLAGRVRRLGNYGSTRKYEHVERGVNSRLDPIQAAVLSVKLRHLPAWNARRQAIADAYARGLVGTALALPRIAADRTSSWHLYVVRSGERDRLRAALADAGIETGIHYPVPPHLQGAFAGTLRPGDLSRTERLAGAVLSLPIGPHLSDAQVERTIAAVRASA